MYAGPGGIGADRKRCKRHWGRLSRWMDERAVDVDLQVMVTCPQEHRLVEERHVLSVGIPLY